MDNPSTILAKQTLLLTNASWLNLFYLSFLIFGIRFIFSVLKYCISHFALRFITATYHNLEQELGNKFCQTRLEDIRKKDSGYYIQRITNDTLDIASFFINITDDIIDILISIGSFLTIFILNKYLFFLFFYFFLLLLFIKKRKTQAFTKAEKRKRQAVDAATNTSIELVRGVSDIKLLNMQESFLKRLNQKTDEFGKRLIELDNVNRFYTFFQNNLLNIFHFLIVSLSIYLINQNLLTIPIALMAFNYESQIFKLLEYIEYFLKNTAKFKKMKPFLLSAKVVLENRQFLSSSRVFIKQKKVKY